MMRRQFRAKHEIFVPPGDGYGVNGGIDLLDESLSFPVVIDPGGFILGLAKAPGLAFNLPAGPPGGSYSADFEARPDETVAEVILR